MATHNFHSFNASELERNIEKLKETKHTCTFKLNLLRDAAASSPTHLPTFDNLKNKLFNIAHQIYELEASDKQRKKVRLSGIGSDQDADGHEIRTGLKGSVMLIGRLDDMLEDIARLKFKLEDVTKGAVEAERAGNVSLLRNKHILRLLDHYCSRKMGLKPQRQLKCLLLNQCRMPGMLERRETRMRMLLAPRSRKKRSSRRKPRKSIGLQPATITSKL
jgi:hypothetical protein